MKDKAEEGLIKLFGSTSRARILALLLENTGRSFYQREIMYETALSLQATQRELSNLVALEIVRRKETRARVYYEINTSSPLFEPFQQIYAAIQAP